MLEFLQEKEKHLSLYSVYTEGGGPQKDLRLHTPDKAFNIRAHVHLGQATVYVYWFNPGMTNAASGAAMAMFITFLGIVLIGRLVSFYF